jgi:hypothetical protein
LAWISAESVRHEDVGAAGFSTQQGMGDEPLEIAITTFHIFRTCTWSAQ